MGGHLDFIAAVDKQRVMRENKRKEKGGGEAIESQACLLLVEQLEVLARRCVKAPFLPGLVHRDYAVSLVSTLLGDNEAIGRDSALA